jgi:hypothetical protein
MAEAAGKGFCGNPESVKQLGETCGQTVTALQRLRARMEQTVSETTLQEKWCGATSSSWAKTVRGLAEWIQGPEKTCATMRDTLHTSAGMLAEAKGILEMAESIADRSGLHVEDDLLVVVVVRSPPPANVGQEALRVQIQGFVYKAQGIAEQAHVMIERMDGVITQGLMAQQENLVNQAVNLSPVAKAAGGAAAAIRLGKRIATGRTPEATLKSTLMSAKRTPVGSVEPAPLGADGRPTTDSGNVMHDRIADMVRQKYPNVQFDPRQPSQVKGPDMKVTGGNPGYDWIEIKPESQSGIDSFVDNQYMSYDVGKDWVGTGKLFTYDNMGTVYEVDHPLKMWP